MLFRLGHRFFTMKNAYDRVLRRRARDAAISIGLELKEGVYTMMGGPNFETPAELRLMKLQGIDAVGENFLLFCLGGPGGLRLITENEAAWFRTRYQAAWLKFSPRLNYIHILFV